MYLYMIIYTRRESLQLHGALRVVARSPTPRFPSRAEALPCRDHWLPSFENCRGHKLFWDQDFKGSGLSLSRVPMPEGLSTS